MAQHSDDGWWHIWDRADLSVYEKAVAQAVYRRQFRGNGVLLARNTIMTLASIGRTKLIECEQSLCARGLLVMSPTKLPHVFLYRVRRGQLDLFDQKKSVDSEGLVKNSVQNAVDNNWITAPLAGARTDTVRAVDAGPPDRPPRERLYTELLTNSKDKTRAEVRPRDALTSSLRAASTAHTPDKRLKIEYRNMRIAREIESLRESIVGAGPGREDLVQSVVEDIARKMESLRPLTQEEWNARRDAQKRALDQRLSVRRG